MPTLSKKVRKIGIEHFECSTRLIYSINVQGLPYVEPMVEHFICSSVTKRFLEHFECSTGECTGLSTGTAVRRTSGRAF